MKVQTPDKIWLIISSVYWKIVFYLFKIDQIYHDLPEVCNDWIEIEQKG